jgi:hypothetical protein
MTSLPDISMRLLGFPHKADFPVRDICRYFISFVGGAAVMCSSGSAAPPPLTISPVGLVCDLSHRLIDLSLKLLGVGWSCLPDTGVGPIGCMRMMIHPSNDAFSSPIARLDLKTWFIFLTFEASSAVRQS